uniref:Uncharacterized protein n=1 Tax=Acrobeloides nanus TaxID=290746 RepID=A0A914C9H7_9BILA
MNSKKLQHRLAKGAEEEGHFLTTGRQSQLEQEVEDIQDMAEESGIVVGNIVREGGERSFAQNKQRDRRVKQIHHRAQKL